jgi:hypothetical protein
MEAWMTAIQQAIADILSTLSYEYSFNQNVT